MSDEGRDVARQSDSFDALIDILGDEDGLRRLSNSHALRDAQGNLDMSRIRAVLESDQPIRTPPRATLEPEQGTGSPSWSLELGPTTEGDVPISPLVLEPPKRPTHELEFNVASFTEFTMGLEQAGESTPLRARSQSAPNMGPPRADSEDDDVVAEIDVTVTPLRPGAPRAIPVTPTRPAIQPATVASLVPSVVQSSGERRDEAVRELERMTAELAQTKAEVRDLKDRLKIARGLLVRQREDDSVQLESIHGQLSDSGAPAVHPPRASYDSYSSGQREPLSERPRDAIDQMDAASARNALRMLLAALSLPSSALEQANAAVPPYLPEGQRPADLGDLQRSVAFVRAVDELVWRRSSFTPPAGVSLVPDTHVLGSQNVADLWDRVELWARAVRAPPLSSSTSRTRPS